MAARTVAGVLLRPALVTAAVVGGARQLRKWRSGKRAIFSVWRAVAVQSASRRVCFLLVHRHAPRLCTACLPGPSRWRSGTCGEHARGISLASSVLGPCRVCALPTPPLCEQAARALVGQIALSQARVPRCSRTVYRHVILRYVVLCAPPPGVSGLIRKLQSGEQSKILEALRAIIAAAAKNPKFAREFNRWAAGVGVGAGEASCRGVGLQQRVARAESFSAHA